MVADPRPPLMNFYLLQTAAFRFAEVAPRWYIAGAEPLVEGTGGRGTHMQFGASGDLVVA